MVEWWRLDFCFQVIVKQTKNETGGKKMKSHWWRGKRRRERFCRIRQGVDVEGFVQRDPDSKLIMEQKH